MIFPFVRGDTWYALDEFLKFEAELLAARRADANLDADLRINRQPWMKLRNEEIYPALHFCRLSGFPSSTEFCIGKEHAVADIEIRSGNSLHRLQMTTAGPLWTKAEKQWGKGHRLLMEQLYQTGESSGWGPYFKQADGSIANRDEAISTAERDPVYLSGIEQALRGKSDNQHSDCELIVYACGYDQAMTLDTFYEIAETALSAVPLKKFKAVHVLASADGYLVSRMIGA
jgi:hypothetical protein